MASKEDQWKRLHKLMLDPDLVYAVTLGNSTWITDRYVLVDLTAARQPFVPKPGTWHLRAYTGPVSRGDEGTLEPKPFQRMLSRLAALSWEPAVVTPWSLSDDDGTWRLLTVNDRPVLMNDNVIRRWPAAFPEKSDTVTWHVARFRKDGSLRADAWVVRATLVHDYGESAKCGPSEHVFGYLMGTRRQVEGPLPPFPKLVTP